MHWLPMYHTIELARLCSRTWRANMEQFCGQCALCACFLCKAHFMCALAFLCMALLSACEVFGSVREAVLGCTRQQEGAKSCEGYRFVGTVRICVHESQRIILM